MDNEPKYLGYPEKNGYAHYAFFDVELGRFVFVCDNLDVAIDVHVISVPRYHTEIVQLDCAENYSWNVLDNDVCEYWSYKNSKSADYWEASAHHVIKSQRLEYDAVMPINTEVLAARKNWFQIYWYWINFMKKLPELAIPNYHVRKVMRAVSDELATTFQNQMAEIERHQCWITNQLFLQSNPKVCHDVIGSYVASDDWLGGLTCER